jgi:DNA-binding CsgD family transcriptional regulator
MVSWSGPNRVTLLQQAIAEASGDDRLRMRLEGVLTGALDLQGNDVREALAHGYAELELGERLHDQVHVATALRGIARNEQRLTGRMPTELIDRSMALEPAVSAARYVLEWPSVCLAEMLSWTDELAAGVERWEWLLTQAAERGETHSRIDTLARAIPYECVAGWWDRALAHADEGCELGCDGNPVHLLAPVLVADRALVEAHLGNEAAARRDADEAMRLEAASGTIMAGRIAAWALGLLELSLREPGRAHDHLGPIVASRRAAGISEPGDMRVVTDDVEALIAAGRLAEAETLLEWFEGLARQSGRIGALAACSRCRGLLHAARGDLEPAVTALEISRDRYATVTEPFGLGRTLLALGTIERRLVRRRAAREALEASLGVFEGLGARIWVERARAELARIGGRRAVRTELTSSEQQVAALVAEGRTNREVAAALVLTERTIEGHLSHVYAKLGIRSRAELARRLAPEAGGRP